MKEGMRCRIHPSDLGAGVCACCLRERLSVLTVSPARVHGVSWTEDRPNLDSSSAPQIRSSSVKIAGNNRDARINRGDPSPKKTASNALPLEPRPNSSSWLLGLTLGRRKQIKKASPHPQPLTGRGMSPAEEEVAEGGLARKPSPCRCISTPSPMRRQHSPRSFSGLGRCLSPLMRPSPGTHRGHATPVTQYPGKLQGTLQRRCTGVGGASVPDVFSIPATNRSRKLVDLGKVW